MTRVLEKEPLNFDALMMLAETVRSPEGVRDALRRLKGVEAEYGKTARFRIALGLLYLKANDLAKAESSFMEALAMDPGNIEVHWGLGTMYLIKKDVKSAEREYKNASEAGHDKPEPQLKLAEFYIKQGDAAEAKRILNDCTVRFPDYIPAFYALAATALEQKNFEELTGLIDQILQKNHADPGALILKGRMHLAQNKASDALKDFQDVGQLHPGTAEVSYWEGIAFLASGDLDSAKAKLREALSSSPQSADATLRLAEVDVRQGSYQSAVNGLESMFDKEPKPPEVYRVLGAAYLGKGDAVKSATCFREFLKTYPDNPDGLYFLAVSLRRQGKNEEAGSYLEKLVKASPGSIDAIAELAGVYVAEKKTELALELVGKQLEGSPGNARLYLLLGTLHMTRKDWKEAETAFLKGIELDPRLSGCYLELAKVYSATNRSDEALARLEEGVAKEPGNAGLQMLSGILYQQKRDMAKARKAYEKVIELDSNNVAALNNLAYVFSEEFGDYDKALKLAQRANELAPDDPHVADTLGWILYKQGNPEWSLGYIEKSASKLPEKPEVQYHLGMVQYKLGNAESAKQALNKALELDPKFSAADEIRRVLAEL